MTESVKALLTSIILTAETQVTEELARKALDMLDTPPAPGATSDEVLSYQFNLVMNYLKAHQLLRPGTFSEIVIHALDAREKIGAALQELEKRCSALENLQPQINRLAEWIQANEPGAIQGEGAVDTAIAIMSRPESSAIMRRNERIVELEKALKPFAEFIAGAGELWADDRRISTVNLPFDKLRFGMFREAHRLLNFPSFPLKPDAATSPGPVNCNIRIQHATPQQPYPKTCERCGLGPCPFFNNDGSAKMQPPNAPAVAMAT